MKSILFVAILLILCLLTSQLNAQIDVKGKIRDKSINRADQKTDEGIDKGLDAVEDGVKNMFKKKEGEDEGTSDEEGNTEAESSSEKKQTEKKPEPSKDEPVKLTSYTKYDFVPGDQIILYDDFSQDEIGDFPALWTTTGSGEVRTLNNFPGKWFYMNAKEAAYNLMKDMELPDNFILEFDVIPTAPEDNEGVASFYLSLYNGSGEFMDDAIYPGNEGFNLTCSYEGWDIGGYKEGAIETTSGNSAMAPIELDKLNHVIIWVQNAG
ncbi:MAG: hypothetical protein HC905_28280 [Bacteroidales bacterium]|nr:hypothetical protein [Bacteroidales bacterium]